MSRFRHRSRALLGITLLLTNVAGCYRTVSRPPEALRADNRIVTVTTRAGREMRLDRWPAIAKDTLRGSSYGGPIAIAMSDVQRVKIRKFDDARTALAVVGTVLGVLAGIVAIGISNGIGINGR